MAAAALPQQVQTSRSKSWISFEPLLKVVLSLIIPNESHPGAGQAL